jgi:hypothetical protein
MFIPIIFGPIIVQIVHFQLESSCIFFPSILCFFTTTSFFNLYPLHLFPFGFKCRRCSLRMVIVNCGFNFSNFMKQFKILVLVLSLKLWTNVWLYQLSSIPN